MTPILSVIIPCYNHGKYIQEAIDSIQLQKYNDVFEVIVINDGSTDLFTINELNRISELGITVIHQENIGLASARNKGIELSRGKYILPLDSDNKIEPEIFIEAASIMEKEDEIDMVYTDAIFFGEKSGNWKVGNFEGLKLLVTNQIDACTLIRKNILVKLGGYDKNMPGMGNEDWELWVNFFLNKRKVFYLPKAGFYYRVSNDSMSVTTTGPSFDKNRNYIYEKHLELIPKQVEQLYFTYQGLKDKKEYIEKNKFKSVLKILLGKEINLIPQIKYISMFKFKIILETYKNKGLYGIKQLFVKKYFARKIKPIKNFNKYKPYFKNKNGIEIGGLSQIFKNGIPIYSIVNGLDGCNFSTKTVWEGTIEEGRSYNFFKSKKGHQYVCEASNLISVPSGYYDFLVSSHCLEHCANTLKTIKEWLRVIKKGGAILLILPDKNNSFDHNRPTTKFEHLLEDYKRNIDEHDLTHLEEILSLHDLSMDIAAGSAEQFRERSLENYSNRCLHHHVFDLDLLKRILDYNNVEIKDTAYANPNHQIILGIKK